MISSEAISVRIGMLPEMNTTEPYSPSARANDRAKPVSSAGITAGKITRQNVCQRVAPRLAAASSDSRSISSIAGCSVRTTNGRPMNVSAMTIPSGENAALIPSGSRYWPIQPFLRIHGRERDAGHGRRQGERQIDQGVDESLAGDRVANERPGDHQAEHGVDRRGDERRAERQLVRGDDARVPRGLPEAAPAHRRALDHERAERQQHDEAQVEHRVAHRQAEAGQDTSFCSCEGHGDDAKAVRPLWEASPTPIAAVAALLRARRSNRTRRLL